MITGPSWQKRQPRVGRCTTILRGINRSRTYDPELAAIIGELPSIDWAHPPAERARITGMGAEAARAVAVPPRVEVRNLDLDATTRSIPLRVYTAGSAHKLGGAVLFLHGGGWAFGDLDSEHGIALEIAAEVGCVVVSVQYRLAPEHPFPAGLDDAWCALRWLVERAGSLGVDARRVAVAGGSAGANLAAALTLRARAAGGPAIAYQQLVVPALDDRRATQSARAARDTPVLNSDGLAWAWRHYTSGGSRRWAAPAREDDLSGLPRAYVEVAEHDPLRDEGISYALRLMHAGVPVELHQYPGTFHGSAELVPDAKVSRTARRRRHAALRRALATTSA